MIISSVLPGAGNPQPPKQDPPAEETDNTSQTDQTQTEESNASEPAPAEETPQEDPVQASEPAQRASSTAPAAQNSASANALALSNLSTTEVAESRGAVQNEADLRDFAVEQLANPNASGGSDSYLEKLFGPLDMSDLVGSNDSADTPRTLLTEAVETYRAVGEYGAGEASELDTI